MPLCITQAAAYIEGNDINLSNYLLELTESEVSLMETFEAEQIDPGRGFDSPDSVLRVLKLSFENNCFRHSQAGELLSIIAFLDRQSISRDMLESILETRHELDSALGVLQQLYLIAPESHKDSFQMHRLV